MKYKFIPVDNNIDKAIAFANTLDVNNIVNVQKIKQKPFYIETMDAVKMLQDEGWLLKGVAEQRGKSRKITSNYAQMHHPDFNILDKKGKTEAFASITLSNSTNGNQPLNMNLGAFRLVCSNGAVRFDNAAESSIKHTEINYRDLPNLIAKMNDKAMVLSDVIKNMQQISMNPDYIKKFAIDAARLRFDDLTDVNIDDLFKVNRVEDEGNDLWTVFNRIQENLTADVTNFNTDIILNQKLFSLADQYALAV
jgi:hypothetical protein